MFWRLLALAGVGIGVYEAWDLYRTQQAAAARIKQADNAAYGGDTSQMGGGTITTSQKQLLE